MFKNKDAYIVGYYGMQNTGDDALMYAAAWGTKHLLKTKTTTVGLYGDYQREHPASHQFNLPVEQRFRGQHRLLNYKQAIQSKRIIFGGGSVLHSETDINIKRHLMSLSSPKKSLAVGVSLGPFQTAAAEKSCAKFLNECGSVGVRDDKSLSIAQDIAPLANVKKTFDIAPLLLCSDTYKIKPVERKGIALALCPVAITPLGNVDIEAERRRINEISQLLIDLHAATNQPITLLEFNGHATLGDWAINNALFNVLNKIIPITIKSYNPNPYEVLQDIAGYNAIISMRLHGSVMGYLAKTPVISINYHQKCAGWCDQVGLAQPYRFDLSQVTSDHLIKPIVNGIKNGFISPTLPVTDALVSALSNWSFTHE